MLDWKSVRQEESDQRCTFCGKALMRTEAVTDEKGIDYYGYVCHLDKQVTWVRVTQPAS